MKPPLRCFVGYDERQPLAFNVLQHSIQRHASVRVIVEPLMLARLPIERRGLTDFTFSRFLVPWLCGYEGVAIFMDPDVAVCGDVAELAACADRKSSVQVRQDQPRFEWASVMLFNCGLCRILQPGYVNDPAHSLLNLEWGEVGEIPAEWNHIVGYEEPREAKLYHYTQGLPCWYETNDLEAKPWLEEFAAMKATCGWTELMGNSVHAKPVIERLLGRYGIGVA